MQLTELELRHIKPKEEWDCLKPGYYQRCVEKARSNPLISGWDTGTWKHY